MRIDLGQHWVLLRLLLVLALAGPLLVFAPLSRGHGRPRAGAGARGAAAEEGRVEASPRPWRAGTTGSERRAA